MPDVVAGLMEIILAGANDEGEPDSVGFFGFFFLTMVQVSSSVDMLDGEGPVGCRERASSCEANCSKIVLMPSREEVRLALELTPGNGPLKICEVNRYW